MQNNSYKKISTKCTKINTKKICNEKKKIIITINILHIKGRNVNIFFYIGLFYDSKKKKKHLY